VQIPHLMAFGGTCQVYSVPIVHPAHPIVGFSSPSEASHGKPAHLLLNYRDGG